MQFIFKYLIYVFALEKASLKYILFFEIQKLYKYQMINRKQIYTILIQSAVRSSTGKPTKTEANYI